MKTITLPDQSGRKHRFQCEEIIDGVALNPVLPRNFDSTANEARPDRHCAWWGVPFIVSYQDTDPKFVKHWGGKTRFDVRCLDGGCWDRSTWWGAGGTIESAIQNVADNRTRRAA